MIDIVYSKSVDCRRCPSRRPPVRQESWECDAAGVPRNRPICGVPCFQSNTSVRVLAARYGRDIDTKPKMREPCGSWPESYTQRNNNNAVLISSEDNIGDFEPFFEASECCRGKCGQRESETARLRLCSATCFRDRVVMTERMTCLPGRAVGEAENIVQSSVCAMCVQNISKIWKLMPEAYRDYLSPITD